MNIKNMKNIYFNARFLTQSVSGVQRYAIELLKALDAAITSKEINADNLSINLLAPKNTKLDLNLKNISLKHVGILDGHMWEQLELPYYAKDGFLVSLCNTGPILKRNQLLTIHDMAEFSIPKNFSFLFRKSYQALHLILSRNVKKIISVSNFSKNQIVKYCKLNPDEIIVIYESGNHIDSVYEDDSIIERNKLSEKPFILAVSSVNPNKNFKSIIQATEYLKDLNFNIVIAGKKSSIFNTSENVFLEKATYVGFVSDSELKSLYKHASCFVFPSFYEGFGLPPLEAMCCACPVIVSNSTALPEICGDSVLYCDPKSPESLAKSIKYILESESLKKELSIKGLDFVKRYSWRKSAIKTFEVIQALA
jgi:glycosyltransferase involved in cell wall biosynthesis